MATKSFLTPLEFMAAQKKLAPPRRPPDGDVAKLPDFTSLEFSKWLGETLRNRLSQHPDWEASAPVALGSWARGELCPKSDIDLLFCGSEEAVRRLVSDFSKEGLKIRSRMPEDLEDWTKGVQPFDVVMLFRAMPMTAAAEDQLRKQVERLASDSGELKKDLLRAMIEERKARAVRYDSIASFLEPNLKFGPGGLRDLEQAQIISDLFPERFQGSVPGALANEHAFEVLRYYKGFLSLVRQKLHLSEGAGDILAAPEQSAISEWLGFKDTKDFMRELQKGVSRVSFYADWVVEQAARSRARIREVQNQSLRSVEDLFKALEEDPSILMQNRIRLKADEIFELAQKDQKKLDRVLGRQLTRFIDPSFSESAMMALFRSRLIDHCVPEFRPIVGYVQHDQYHRFTVDAHIRQALRELKRLYKQPKLAGKLSRLVRSLTDREWEILSFAALYHDIAKGRGGDHSIKGIEMARRDLERFGKSASFIREVCWLVEEHLSLSVAAFRENHRSPRTWNALAEKGVRGRRLPLLAVFTIVDIRATNPEAWTSWKERLLHELIEQLEHPQTDSMIGFSDALKATDLGEMQRLVETLDPFLIGSIPPRLLIHDLKTVLDSRNKEELLKPKVIRVTGGNQTWIRFSVAVDRPGLFLQFVSRLAASGLSIRHASILTDQDLGVYDWFEVKTTKSPVQIRKLLAAATHKERRYQIQVDSIELVAADDQEWVISFRGRDQSGALTEAARALYEEGAEIRWAKVHTWGRQIDDVFGILPLEGGPKALLEKLSERLARSSEQVNVFAGPKF